MIRSLTGYITKLFLLFKHYHLRSGFAISSHLTHSERLTLYELARNPEVRTCLEIGSYLGASAFFMSAGLARKGCTGSIFCIDTWNNDAMSEGTRNTYAEFAENTIEFSKFIIPVRGFSTAVIEQVAEQTKQIDLLFIDGDHSYEGVKADWDAYKQFLKPGSVVVFHDWDWAEGVKRVIEEDVKQLVSQWDSLPNMWWGTLR